MTRLVEQREAARILRDKGMPEEAQVEEMALDLIVHQLRDRETRAQLSDDDWRQMLGEARSAVVRSQH